MTASESKKKPVVAIVGPTSTGKTALSLKIAEVFNGEVIACDSRNVYKYMDIGTAKPTAEEQARIPHHLLDVAEPDQVFTAAQFKEYGEKALQDIAERGKLPIVCGGTGFYARALLEGLDIPAVPPQEDLRERLNEIADREGNSVLYEKLKEMDPQAAKKLNENDRFRIIRAIEVTEVLGRPFSQAVGRVDLPYNVLWIGLTVADRGKLKESIIKRLQQQIEEGLIEEAAQLYKKYGPTRALTNAVTYKEFIQYIDGKITLEQAEEECVKHNYQLARRQLIWFRANPSVKWFAIDRMERTVLVESVTSIVKAHVEPVSRG